MALHYGAMLRECIRHQSVASKGLLLGDVRPRNLFRHLNALSTAEPVVGGWHPIKDLKSKEVQDVSQFAVSEHNKQANDKLQYQRVVRGHTQVVAGTNYRLVIAAKDGPVLGNYEALVWDKPWMNFRNLTSFRKV